MPNDAGRYEWAKQEWLKDLFEVNPTLVSLAERHSDGDRSFDFNFIITVKSSDGYHYRLLEWPDFNYNSISHFVETFVADYPNVGLRWMYTLEVAESAIRARASRHDFDLSEAADTIAAQQKQKVLEENREWMERAFRMFPGLTRIVKSANTSRSPTTFALCVESQSRHYTWMKAPDFEKIRVRMKTDLMATRSSPPHLIWVPGAVPAEQVGIEFTPEDFATMNREKSTLAELAASGRFNLRVQATRLGLLDTGEARQWFMSMDDMAAAKLIYAKLYHPEPHVVSEPDESKPEPKAPDCSSCGISLATNMQFGTGEEKLCGECELKHDEANGQRTVNLELVFVSKRRRLKPPPKKPSKHDPIPGVHDQGAWSSPSWEDNA